MSDVEQAPWGEPSFQRDRHWYGSLLGECPEEYSRTRKRALEDPTYDFFDHIMPTGRPKFDIGRYAMRYAVSVPLATSMTEWQACLDDGTAMIRSELHQDYKGYSGLLDSVVIPRKIDTTTYDDYVSGTRDTERLYRNHRESLGTAAVRSAFFDIFDNGIYDGTVNPTVMMQLLVWDNRGGEANYAQTSRWRYVPGVNIRIMRDPVIEGKYFIGGEEDHHHWEITDGRDTEDLKAYDKGVYRSYIDPGDPEYTLPARKIVDLYEKVRTLPLFDTSQAPVMEMQYGTDGKLYFLQYLKTGNRVGDPGEFALPEGRGIVTAHGVRGATKKEGERVRIYLDPPQWSDSMTGQSVIVGDGMSQGSVNQQRAAIQSKVAIIDYFLAFKNNHYDDAVLTRAPVAIGLVDNKGEAAAQFSKISAWARGRNPLRHDNPVEYINAVITSNGRRATIESDWDVHD